MTPRLKDLYFKEIQPALKNQFGFWGNWNCYLH